jgi:cell division protein FtsQ
MIEDRENIVEQLQRESVPVRHSKRVYAALACVAIIALVLIIGMRQWQRHLPLSHVEVTGEQILSNDEVIQLAQIPSQTGLFDIELTSIEQNISRNPFVQQVIVKREAPSTLRIYVKERTPLAVLSMNTKGELLLIDQEGVVLPHVTTQAVFDIPVISGIDSASSCVIGKQTVNQNILDALDILVTSQQVSNELFHLISEVQLSHGHDIVLFSSDNGVPILFGRGDAAEKLVKLDAFWKQFIVQEGNTSFQYIDLRFEGQVIVANSVQQSS